MKQAFMACPIKPSIASATEVRFVCSLRIVDRKFVTIQETCLACVAFLRDDDPYSHQVSFIGEDLNEASMRDLDKLLIVFPPHLHLLLPESVLANDEGADPLCDQQIDNTTACRVQIVLHAAVSLRREAI